MCVRCTAWQSKNLHLGMHIWPVSRLVQLDTAFQLSLSCYMAVAWVCQLFSRGCHLHVDDQVYFSLAFFTDIVHCHGHMLPTSTWSLWDLDLAFCSVHAASSRSTSFRHTYSGQMQTSFLDVLVMNFNSRQCWWMAEKNAGGVCPGMQGGVPGHAGGVCPGMLCGSIFPCHVMNTLTSVQRVFDHFLYFCCTAGSKVSQQNSKVSQQHTKSFSYVQLAQLFLAVMCMLTAFCKICCLIVCYSLCTCNQSYTLFSLLFSLAVTNLVTNHTHFSQHQAPYNNVHCNTSQQTVVLDSSWCYANECLSSVSCICSEDSDN